MLEGSLAWGVRAQSRLLKAEPERWRGSGNLRKDLGAQLLRGKILSRRGLGLSAECGDGCCLVKIDEMQKPSQNR